MIPSLIGIAAILIVLVLILLFRASALLSVARGSDWRPGGLLNKFNGAMFLVFMALGTIGFFWYTFGHKDDYLLPEAVSIHGKNTDFLLNVTFAIIIAVFLLVNATLFFFAWKYQYKKGTKANFFPENSQLEIVWTVIPAIVLTFLVFNGWKEWTKITTAPTAKQSEILKPVELEIVGQQFNWSIRYPGQDGKLGEHYFRRIAGFNPFGIKVEDENGLDDFSPRPTDYVNTKVKKENKPEIHLPVGRKVHLRIRAKDVLHSVFAPHFRLKMDAVPGTPTEFWFTPTKTTQQMRNELENQEFNYEIACTEICGRGHFNMKALIIVETQEEYDAWYASQKPWSVDNKEDIAKVLSEIKPDKKEELLKVIDGLSPEAEVAAEEAVAEEVTLDSVEVAPTESTVVADTLVEAAE